MTDRTGKLLPLMAEKGMSHMLVTKFNNMRYLTGYTGEGALLVTKNQAVIITDFRYVEQAQRQAPMAKVLMTDGEHSMFKWVKQVLADEGGKELAVEEDQMTVATYHRLEKELEGTKLVSAEGLTESIRVIKEPDEIACIRKACAISCAAFEKLLGIMHTGMTEKQVQRALDDTMLDLGAEGIGFSTIAAAGVNGSLPHAIPGDHVIASGEMLTLDFGASYGGYKADMTRTVAFGQISDELRAIYDTVLETQLAALSKIGPGVRCCDLDNQAHDYINARYNGAFGHSLGHGVGLDIHEQPGLSWRDERPLVPGHVVTVEPGVYLPGVGGCRIEDSVVITESGYDNLVTSPKELITL